MKRILSIILFAAGVFGVGQAKEQLSPDQTLWFTSPAENWAQQALHIGNGYMGASFYGSVNRERFDIAEKTFWTGGPHSLSDFKSPIIKGGKDKIDEIRKLIVEKKYVEADSLCRKYMVGNYSHYGYFSMVGNLYIDFPESEHPVKDYVRGIDLSTSRGFVEYVQEDTYFKREYFCSYPDKLMVLHFTSDKKNKINFNLSQILTYPASQVKKETDGLVFNGVIKGNGLKYCIRIKVLQEGGTVSIVNQNICIEGADQATVLYAVDTEYKQEYPLYKGENPQNNTAKIIKNAGIPVLYDFSDEWTDDKLQSICKNINIAFFSGKDLDEECLKDYLAKCVDSYGCYLAITTIGGRGAIVYNGRKFYRKLPYNFAGGVIDTTGAGDSWITGFISSYIDNMKKMEILKKNSPDNFLSQSDVEDFEDHVIEQSMCLGNLLARRNCLVEGSFGKGSPF